MSESEEEMVAVNLGDDYYLGACFSTDSPRKDHLVQRSQLERWEAAKAAYEQMQSEIDKVMDEQRERIREINAARPKSPMAEFLGRVYEKRLIEALQVPATFRGVADKESK